MLLNQDNVKDLRSLFCDAVINIFKDVTTFLDFIENEEYSIIRYDCYIDSYGENYIINRETGEYINWYKFNHIGRAISISVLSNHTNISEWLEKFLVEFKGEEAINMDSDKWDRLYNYLNDTRLAVAPVFTAEFKEYNIRAAEVELIDEIMEYMEQLEQEEYDET